MNQTKDDALRCGKCGVALKRETWKMVGGCPTHLDCPMPAQAYAGDGEDEGDLWAGADFNGVLAFSGRPWTR